MNTKQLIFWLIFICSITFFTLSCASPEKISSAYYDESNFILLGFWHGTIIPFSAIGKLFGLNVGIYEAGRNLSYFAGFAFAIFLYSRIIRFLYLAYKENKQFKS